MRPGGAFPVSPWHVVPMHSQLSMLSDSAGTLQPGSLVNAKIVKILDDGLVLSFLTYFSGTVNSFHIPQVSIFLLGRLWQCLSAFVPSFLLQDSLMPSL